MEGAHDGGSASATEPIEMNSATQNSTKRRPKSRKQSAKHRAGVHSPQERVVGSTSTGMASSEVAIAEAAEVERRRHMNMIHSRRKREREKIEIEVLREQCESYSARNLDLFHKNKQLEGHIEEAKRCVADYASMSPVEQVMQNRPYTRPGTSMPYNSDNNRRSIPATVFQPQRSGNLNTLGAGGVGGGADSRLTQANIQRHEERTAAGASATAEAPSVQTFQSSTPSSTLHFLQQLQYHANRQQTSSEQPNNSNSIEDQRHPPQESQQLMRHSMSHERLQLPSQPPPSLQVQEQPSLGNGQISQILTGLDNSAAKLPSAESTSASNFLLLQLQQQLSQSSRHPHQEPVSQKGRISRHNSDNLHPHQHALTLQQRHVQRSSRQSEHQQQSRQPHQLQDLLSLLLRTITASSGTKNAHHPDPDESNLEARRTPTMDQTGHQVPRNESPYDSVPTLLSHLLQGLVSSSTGESSNNSSQVLENQSPATSYQQPRSVKESQVQMEHKSDIPHQTQQCRYQPTVPAPIHEQTRHQLNQSHRSAPQQGTRTIVELQSEIMQLLLRVAGSASPDTNSIATLERCPVSNASSGSQPPQQTGQNASMLQSHRSLDHQYHDRPSALHRNPPLQNSHTAQNAVRGSAFSNDQSRLSPQQRQLLIEHASRTLEGMAADSGMQNTVPQPSEQTTEETLPSNDSVSQLLQVLQRGPSDDGNGSLVSLLQMVLQEQLR